MQSHIRTVYACLAVTCHLHFWQNDRDLLCATAVTRGWNGYRNESQHRKSTLEKKILPPLLQGFEPATFQSRVRRSNHWAVPLPSYNLVHFCKIFSSSIGHSHSSEYSATILRYLCFSLSASAIYCPFGILLKLRWTWALC